MPKFSIVQFGFLEGRSAVQQLWKTYASITEWSHNNSQADAILFLDYARAKAFDSIPHNELLWKLRGMGICGDVWLWFRSYLVGRQQFVCLGDRLTVRLVCYQLYLESPR